MIPCKICRAPSVGKCTKDIRWNVCIQHFILAALNSFYPKFYGETKKTTPDEALALQEKYAAPKNQANLLRD